MDFFEHQDQARKNTKLLVAYFLIAVAGIIASVYLASLLIFYGSQFQQQSGGPTPALALWNPQLFLYVVIGTLGVVAIGSLYKTAALAKGGSAVAESLGGRLVNPNTTDPDERQLRNVIEEMAIASGVPAPEIYVLDDEDGINAFAAGHTPSDAAIGVTRGCMTLLNRDELQGVIGHEFSHILNGDMRLNLRLMGVIFGIVCLTVIGRILLYSRGGRGRDRNPMMLLGLALIVIGAIGVFFGRLIQAALSRQREFLADASAVQFTRNPAGLSGALQKIGSTGSRLVSAHAEEASHMFFGNGLKKSLFGAMATHPPLEARIRAIDPGWDGEFRHGDAPAVAAESTRETVKSPSSQFPLPPIPGIPGMRAGTAGFAANAVQVAAVLPSLGNPTPLHLRYAVDLRSAFSESVQSAAREPLDAAALIFAMLLSTEQALRAKQLTEIARRIGPELGETTAALWPQVGPAALRARLPLANLALPALRHLRPGAFQQFSQTLQWLIESDAQIDIFEFVLQKIVRRHLAPQLGENHSRSIKYRTLAPLVRDCDVVLSALAYASSSNAAEIEKAFKTGALPLQTKADGRQLLPREECGLKQLDNALDRLALATPHIKKIVVEACLQVVGADGLIQERQAELLRAIADTLDCPIPAFIESN
ncbi:MAG: M48 family metallopeptidase [Burkholderiaceae bacterium]